MQRSGQFVLYRQVMAPEGSPHPFVRVYFCGYGSGEDNNNYSSNLGRAMVVSKAEAFKFALKYTTPDENWCVGELISDAKGTRVEE